MVFCNIIHASITQEYNLHIRVFPKVDHSGNDARIVLGQNKFSKKSNLQQCLNPRPYDCSIFSPMPIQLSEVQPHAFLHGRYHILVLCTIPAPMQFHNAQTNNNGILTIITFRDMIRYKTSIISIISF